MPLGTVLAVGDVGKWLLGFGGPGLIVIGLLDNSIIPMPGSMDIFVILLTSGNKEWWPYYGAMATLGAVIGGYVTYRLAEKGGEEGLEKKIGKRRAQKVYKKFEKRGFSTVVVGSMIPPPFPLVPVLMSAGVLHYSQKKFLTALSLGRGVRYFVIAFLGRLYGTAIVGWFSRYYRPFLYVLITVGVLGGIAAFVYFKWYRPKHRHEKQVKTRKAA